MLEYSRVLTLSPPTYPYTSGIMLFVVQLDRLKRKSIMIDNLWFWISDTLNEYEKEGCNLLSMHVELFTSISKNLHGHNFQNSWRIATQIRKLLPVNKNFRM